MICHECGFDNPDEATRCTQCSGSLAFDAPAEPDGDATMAVPPPDATVAFPTSPSPGGTAGWSKPPPPNGGEVLQDGRSTLPTGLVLAERYEIVKMLGEGGMGAVYRAQDRELDRPVALKVVRPELTANPAVLQRFKQELILAREVTHPNVVRIFDLGTSDGIKFITMEFVEGQDLKSLIVEGHRFSTDETLDIARQVCLALKAAHDAGIVHRDLKPQNIMIDGAGRAKVMDFGVARSMEESGLTRTGQMIGTPDYMSPEQAKGEPADARSDLFGLGIILYELLVGEMPYQSDTAFGTLIKRTQEVPVPPRKRDSDVPVFINDIVVKCLQIDADLRYQSAQAIIEDIDGRLAPSMASPLVLLRSRLRRMRPATLWMTLALVAALVTTGALLLTGRRTAPAPKVAALAVEPVSLAILPFRNASGDARADWLQSSLAEMLRTDIGQSAQLRTVPSDRVLQILSDLKLDPATNLDPATLRRLADHSNAQLILFGTFTKLGDRIRIDATLHDVEKNESTPVKTETADEEQLLASISRLAQSVRESLDLSAEAIRELEDTSFSPSSDSLDALRAYNDGLQFERQGNYLDALESFKTAVRIDSRFALAQAKLGQVFTSLGRDGEGERASRTAVELSEELPEYERHLIQASHAMILNDHAQALAAYQRLAEAAPADPQINFSLADLHEKAGDFDRARERLERVLGSDPNYVDALYAMGRVQIRSGNPQAALDSLNRALMLTVQAENEDGRGRVLNAIGIAYKRLDRPEEALRYYQESLEIRRRLDQKSGIAASLNEIADVQGTLGNTDEARASLEAALELLRDIGDRTGIGESLIGLGTFHHQLGQSDAALEYYKDSLQIQREIGNTMDEALCLNNIGVVYLERGEFGDALTNFEQSLRLREESGAVYELGETLFNLGETASALGRFGRALDYYLRALEQMRTSQDDLGVTAALHGIGVILGQQGRFRASLESLEEAMQTLEASGEKGYWQVVVTARYGAALNAVGRFDQAREVLGTASGLAAELGNPSLVAQVLDIQGLGLTYRGELEQAASRFEAALDRAVAADDRKNVLSSRLHLAETALRQDRPSNALGELQEVAREADDLGLKYVALESVVRLGEALLAQGDAQTAGRHLRGALSDLERGELRVLLADCHVLLARIDEAGSDADGAARHRRQGRRILDEIREEAGDEEPFRRQDLQAIEAAVSDDSR